MFEFLCSLAGAIFQIVVESLGGGSLLEEVGQRRPALRTDLEVLKLGPTSCLLSAT